MSLFMILKRYPSLFEAELARSILESYNIYAEVLDKNLAFSLYGATISQWYRLQIKTIDKEKALEILESNEENSAENL